MTFKEFNEWCNCRACDGRWSANTSIYCMAICRKISALPFWKREKAWDEVKDFIEKEIVQVIDKKIALIRASEQKMNESTKRIRGEYRTDLRKELEEDGLYKCVSKRLDEISIMTSEFSWFGYRYVQEIICEILDLIEMR